MPDAKQRRPESTRDGAARAARAARPTEVAGRADAVTDALRVATDGRAAAPTRPPWPPPFAICDRTGGWTTSGRCVDIPRGRPAAGRPTLLEDEVQPLPTLLLDTPDAGLPDRYLTPSKP